MPRLSQVTSERALVGQRASTSAAARPVLRARIARRAPRGSWAWTASNRSTTAAASRAGGPARSCAARRAAGGEGGGTLYASASASRCMIVSTSVGGRRRMIRSATIPVQPGLVRRAEPGAVVAVEVLVEQDVVLPRRVGLQPLDPAEAGPPPVGPDEEQRDEPAPQVLRDLAHVSSCPSRSGTPS